MFKFHILLNDKDYYEFNKFVSIDSVQAKKRLLRWRLSLCAFMAAVALILMALEGFSAPSAFGTAFVFIIGIIVFNLLANPISKLNMKISIKTFSKTGKRPYTQDCVMEFNENDFCEIAADSKTESTYSALENVSIISNKYIYLHIDRLRAYIIPFSVFESSTQSEEFIAFLSKKCEITKYDK